MCVEAFFAMLLMKPQPDCHHSHEDDLDRVVSLSCCCMNPKKQSKSWLKAKISSTQQKRLGAATIRNQGAITTVDKET